MDTNIIIALVISAIVLIAVAALWMKRRKRRVGDIPLFDCSITGEGKDPGKPNTPDVYDCVEVKENASTADKKT